MEDLNIYAWDMTGMTQHLSSRNTWISKAGLGSAALGENGQKRKKVRLAWLGDKTMLGGFRESKNSCISCSLPKSYLTHSRCPPLSPGVCSNSCPLSH